MYSGDPRTRLSVYGVWIVVVCCWQWVTAPCFGVVEKTASKTTPAFCQGSIKKKPGSSEFDAIKIKSDGVASNGIVSVSKFRVTRREDVVSIEAEISNLTSETLYEVRLAPGFALDENDELIFIYTPVEFPTVTIKTGERAKYVQAVRTPSKKCNLRAQIVHRGSHDPLMFTVELDVPPDEKAATRLNRRID